VGYAFKPDTRYVFFEFYLFGSRGMVELMGRVGIFPKKERLTCMCECSIQTWALEEARRRLEKEGILADPDKKE
jgi:hypothetical protein